MSSAPGSPPIQAHICVKGAVDAVAFYEKGFGATCVMKTMAEDGKRVFHAILVMFDSQIMLYDEFGEFGAHIRAPTSPGGASLSLTVNRAKPSEVDALVAKALAAGATVLLEPQDVFWGSRFAQIGDPFGHVWGFNAPLTPA